MEKNIIKEFAKLLKMAAKNPQFSGVQSVELINGEKVWIDGKEVWADELSDEDIKAIEAELGGKYKVQSRLPNGSDAKELYLKSVSEIS